MACRIFIDTETTGLDPAAGELLEVAVVATDETPAYTEIAHAEWVIRPEGDRWLVELGVYVREMHTKNGLLADVAARGVAVEAAEDALLGFLRYYGNPAPGREPIGGSSAHFDAAWLAEHMPRARRYFSHRVFDASTLRRFARDLGLTPPEGDPAHRALADVRASIATARWVANAVRGL